MSRITPFDFDNLKDKYKDPIIACAICPHNLYPEVINAIFRYYKLNTEECNNLWTYLNSHGFVDKSINMYFNAKGVKSYVPYFFGESAEYFTNLTPATLEIIFPYLKEHASFIDDLDLKSAWQKGLVRAENVLKKFDPDEYYWFLKRLFTCGKVDKNLCPKQAFKKTNYVEDANIIETFKYVFFNCIFARDDYQDFFDSLAPSSLCLILEAQYSLCSITTFDFQAKRELSYFKKISDTPIYHQTEAWALLQEFFAKGDLDKYLNLFAPDTVEYFVIRAIEQYQKDNAAEAVKIMRKALSLQKKLQNRNSTNERFFSRIYENWLYGLFLYAARLVPANEKTINAILKDKNRDNVENVFLTLFCAIAREEDPNYYLSDFIEQSLDNKFNTPLCGMMFQIIRYGLHVKDLKCTERLKTTLLTAYSKYEQVYPLWYESFLAVCSPQNIHLAELERTLKMKPFITYTKEKEEWEKLLDKMLAYEEQDTSAISEQNVAQNLDRYAYYLKFYEKGSYKDLPLINPAISIRYQHSRNAGKTWSKGKEIKLKDFRESQLPNTTEFEKEMATRVNVDSYTSWNRRLVTVYNLNGPHAALGLIGCPNVYDEYGEHPLEIVKGTLQLSVKNSGQKFKISSNIDHLLPEDPDQEVPKWMTDEPVDNKVTIFELSDDQRRIISGLRKAKEMPKEAESKLTRLLESISSKMPVMSNLLKDSDKLKKIDGDSQILLQLVQPSAGAFEANAVVHPVANSKLYCKPGSGQEFIATVVDNTSVQICRNLKREKENFNALLDLLTPLEECHEDKFIWNMDIEQCLAMLNLVRESKLCTVQWPDGEKFKVTKAPLKFSSINLSVRSMGSWFEVSGEVKIDDKTKMQVEELMRLIRESQGNFINLGDNEYIALTENLKKQLSMFDKTSSKDGKKIKVSRFNSGVLDELEKNGSELKTDKQYRELKERIAQAASTTPKLPKNLNASLRDYQEEGFEWMMRLASWGAGAVLADDMGLGKTIQAISVLLSRAQSGAQIVVAPAALLINWKNEINRFAPSLKPVVLNFETNRAEIIKKASKNSILLVTYGVVSEEIEDLAQKDFITAVFDEAHNIKNRDTKAFKNCVQIKADFRIMLTGTPLQNHLTEIWSLFEVAVPGLLGSFNAFTERFVMPVERDHDVKQQRLLKRIVSPFILRRTKADVLNELPEKTEITVEVDLSVEEKAFYDNIRQQTALSLSTGEINPMQALAALTKLRQAACSMELIDKKLTIRSSKTEAFLSLVDELIENNHRALVFSQFTSHLAIIRRELDQKNIKYLYLDGSMSPKERMKLVEKFDEGDMPLFLISLKAGGTGLNLTAADYVIHLDPWWNPAIEEQASDRAYRIGQERQVTVYRLIAKGTVEDKIIKLHATKKSLADALLEGTEMSSRLGREEIMELLALAEN